MHSSMMHTVRCSGHVGGVSAQGGCLPKEECLPRGYLPRAVVCLGGCLPRGVYTSPLWETPVKT